MQNNELQSTPQVLETKESEKLTTITKRKPLWVWTAGVAIMLIAIVAVATYALQKKPAVTSNNQGTIKPQQVDTKNLSPEATSFTVTNDRVVVNGQLQANANLLLTPTNRPDTAVAGLVYIDKSTGEINYYNGHQYLSLVDSTSLDSLRTSLNSLNLTNIVSSLQGQNGNLTLGAGSGISISGLNITNSGVTSLQNKTGALSLTAGGGISISGLNITNSGVTRLQGASGALTLLGTGGLSINAVGSNISLDLPQNLATTANPSFAGLTLGSALPIASGGTGQTSFTADGVIVSDDSGVLGSVTAGSNGLCLVSGAGVGGAPGFTACNGSNPVESLNGLSGDLTIANANGSGSTITIDDAATDGTKGIATFNSTNFNATAGVINTVQNINTVATPTFNGLHLSNALALTYGGTGGTDATSARNSLIAAKSGANSDIISTNGLNTITPTSSLTIGSQTQSFTLQGNASSLLTSKDSGIGGSNFKTSLGYYFGSGGSAPTGNVTYQLQNDNTVAPGTYQICTTVGNCFGAGGVTSTGGTAGTIAVFTGAQAVGDSILSQSGSNITIANAGGTAGALSLKNNSNSHLVTLQAGITNNGGNDLTLTLPTQDGNSGDCLSTNGSGILAFNPCLSGAGGGLGGVVSLDGLSGSLTLANSSGLGSTVTIDNAVADGATKGIAAFDSNDFTDNGNTGIISTIQGINTADSPQFSGLTLTGDLTLGTANTIFANNLTHTAGGQDITLDAGNNEIIFSAFGKTYHLPNTGGASQTICTQATNCTAGGGTAVLLGPNTIQTDTATDPSININKTGNSDFIHFQYNGSDKFTLTNAGDIVENGTTFSFPVGGGANQTICTTAVSCVAGGGTAVLLGPNDGFSATAQPNGTAYPSIFINNTAGANLLELQNTSVDKFKVDSSGNTTIAGNLLVSGLSNGVAIVTGGTGQLSSEAQLAVVRGGTGSSTASGARSNLGAAASGANSDITSTTFLNTITPNGALTVGATSQQFTLQGTSASTITGKNGSFTTTLGFSTPTANVTYNLNTAVAGTYNICTSAGNCAGAGGGVTTSGGTTGTIAYFTGAQTIGDSILSQSGSTLTITNGVGTPGALSFKNQTNSNTITLQSPSGANAPGSNLVFTLPKTDGTNGDCLSTNGSGVLSFTTCLSGGGGGGGVTDLDTLSGSIVIANSNGSGGIITINNAVADGSTKGIATFNSTNFGDNGSGVINTKQDINNTATPTFAGLTLTTTPLGVNSGGTGCNNASSPDLATCVRTNFNAAKSGANSDITSTTGLSSITATTLQVNGNDIFVPSSIPSTTAFQIQNAAGTSRLFTVDTSNNQVILGKAGTTTGKLTFASAGGGNVSLQADASLVGNVTFTLPTADGTSGQCLETNGSAALVFVNCVGGAGGGNDAVTSLNSFTDAAVTIQGTTNQINVNNSSNVITLSTPQDINTSSSPTFAGLTVNGGITTSGNITFSGTSARTITGPTTGGLTINDTTGNLTLSTTTSGTLAVTSAGALNLTGAASSTWDLGAAHTLSLQTTNNGPISTGTGAISLNGATTLASGKNLLFANGSGTITVQSASGTGTLTLPAETGTICSNNTSTGSCVVLQNSTPGSQQTGNLNISGTAVLGTSIQSPLVDSISGAVAIGTTNASAINIGKTSSNITTTVTGQSVFKPSTGNDTSTAFRIQNAAGSNILNADTTAQSANLVTTCSGCASTNSDFETAGATSWAKKVGTETTLATTTSQFYAGARSLQITTSAAANEGAKLTLSNFAASTPYVFSVYMKTTSSTPLVDVVLGFRSKSSDSDTTSYCVTPTNIGLKTVTTSWQQFICSFTTSASADSTGFIYVKKTSTAVETFYLDQAELYSTAGAKISLGSVGNLDGQLQFVSTGVSGGGSITLQAAPSVAGNFVLTLPGESGTICTDNPNSNCSIASDGKYLSKVSSDFGAFSATTGGSAYLLWNLNSASYTNTLTLVNASTGSAVLKIGTFSGASSAILLEAGNCGDFVCGESAFTSLFTVNKISSTAAYVGISTAAPNNDLSFGNGADRTINVQNSTSGSGKNLTITAGSAPAGDNASGGSLSLQAGGAGQSTSANGAILTLSGGSYNSSTITDTAGNATLQGGDSPTCFCAASTGGTVTIRGGYGNSVGTSTGGDVLLRGGSNSSGGGTEGSVIVRPFVGNHNVFQVQSVSQQAVLNVDTAANTSGVTVMTNSNNTHGFQVQGSFTENIFDVDTSTTQNKVRYGGFENFNYDSDLTGSGWTAKGGATLTQLNSQREQGMRSLQIGTSALASDGAKYTTGASTLLSSCTAGAGGCMLSFYAKTTTSSMTTFQFGYSLTGTSEASCASAQTVTTVWTQFNCSFSTSGVTSGNYIYFKQTDATARNILIDAVQLEVGGTVTTFNPGGQIQLLGGIDSPVVISPLTDSANIFEIQNAVNGTIFNVDTLTNGNGAFTIGNSSSAVDIYGAISLRDATTLYDNFTQNGAGTFSTGSGAVSLRGDTTLSGGKSLTMSSGSGRFQQTYNGTGTDAFDITANSLTVGNAFNVTGKIQNTTNVSSQVIQLNVTNAQATVAASGANITSGVDLEYTQAVAIASNNDTALNVAVASNTVAATDNTLNSIINVANNDTATGNQITATDGILINGANVTHGLYFNGTFGTNLINTSTGNFVVTQAGAVSAVGVDANGGVIQGTLGLTTTGATSSINASSNFATNINTGTSSGTISLGGGSAPLQINSTAFDVSTAGALSGITTISTSGAINTNTFTGSALTFGTANTATIQSAASQALTVTGHNTSTWSTDAGSLTVQAATTNTLTLNTGGAGTVNVGTTNSTTVSVGNASSNTTLTGNTSSSVALGNFSVTAAGAITAASTYNTNTFTGSALTFGTAGTATIQSAAAQALTVTGHAASTFSTDSGQLTVQSGSGTLSFGTSTALTANAGLTIQAATTNTLTLNTAGAGTVNLGTTNSTTVAIGSSSASSVAVDCATAATACNFGATANAHTTLLGSSNTTAATTLQSGSGGISISSTGTIGIQSAASTNINIGTTTNLTVTIGSSGGTLTVASAATFNGTLTVGKHIISSNSSGSTSYTVGAAACTGGANTGSAGNDTAGKIVIVAGGSGCTTGTLMTIGFANNYGAAPAVVITPGDSVTAAAGLQYYVTPGTTNFTLNTANTTVAGTTYTFYYHVIQ